MVNLKDCEYKLGENLYEVFIRNKDSNDPSEDREINNFVFNYYANLLNENFFELNSPIRLLWKITSKCNMSCEHCWAKMYNKDIDEEIILKTAKEVANSGVFAVSLSGGEPIIRFDLLVEVIRLLKTRNIVIEILTNATLLNDDKISLLSSLLNHDSDIIQVSLDGSNITTYGYQRHNNMFEKVKENIKIIVKSGLKVRVSFTATSHNIDDIFNTYNLCNELGVNVMSISPVFPIRKGLKFKYEFDQEKYLNEILRCKKVEKNYKTKLRIQFTQHFQYELSEYLSNVNNNSLLEYQNFKFYPDEGLLSLQIDASGFALPGPEWENEIIFGNIYKDGFKKVYRNVYSSIISNGRDLSNTKCSICNVFKICKGGNMKYAFNNNNDGNISDFDMTCEVEI